MSPGFEIDARDLRYEPKSGTASRFEKRTQRRADALSGECRRRVSKIDARFTVRTQFWPTSRFERRTQRRAGCNFGRCRRWVSKIDAIYDTNPILANGRIEKTNPTAGGMCFRVKSSPRFDDARFAVRTQIWPMSRFEKTNPTVGGMCFWDVARFRRRAIYANLRYEPKFGTASRFEKTTPPAVWRPRRWEQSQARCILDCVVTADLMFGLNLFGPLGHPCG
jgi:hypothetical protein